MGRSFKICPSSNDTNIWSTFASTWTADVTFRLRLNGYMQEPERNGGEVFRLHVLCFIRLRLSFTRFSCYQVLPKKLRVSLRVLHSAQTFWLRTIVIKLAWRWRLWEARSSVCKPEREAVASAQSLILLSFSSLSSY
jgi:hypothetical protein